MRPSGLCSQELGHVILHSPLPSYSPPSAASSNFGGGLALALPPVTQAGSVPRLVALAGGPETASLETSGLSPHGTRQGVGCSFPGCGEVITLSRVPHVQRWPALSLVQSRA